MADESQGSLLTKPSELEELVAHLRQEGRFAFDTEFVSEETFEPVLCLVQVATRRRLALIDAMEVRDLAPFWDAVTDPAVAVVMHAAGEDLRICRLRTGRLPRQVFDVQIAAGIVGFGYPLSLGNLINQTLGIAVTGGETRTDWRRRPLSPGQIRYALDDVRHLLDIADLLQARLDESGRTTWAEAEFADFLDHIEGRGDEDRWRRLSGIHQLNRRGLEVARRLSGWRQEDARRANRPLRQVLRDDLLVAIARRQPASRRDLEALRDFNRPALLNKAAEILAVVAEAQRVPTEQLPEPAERLDEGPGLSMVVSLLAASLTQCCVQQQVAAGLVGTNGDLKDLIRWYAEGRPEAGRPALVRGWRDAVCGQTLLDVLAGRRALRVVDPLADVPVALEPLEGPGTMGPAGGS